MWIDIGSDEDKLLDARHAAHRVVDDIEERVLIAAERSWKALKEDFTADQRSALFRDDEWNEINETRGATTDEILFDVYDGHSYVGRQGLHDKVAHILERHGYLRRRWSLHPKLPKEKQRRWRHKDWPAPKRGNPALAKRDE